jgi:hypothetical protein
VVGTGALVDGTTVELTTAIEVGAAPEDSKAVELTAAADVGIATEDAWTVDISMAAEEELITSIGRLEEETTTTPVPVTARVVEVALGNGMPDTTGALVLPTGVELVTLLESFPLPSGHPNPDIIALLLPPPVGAAARLSWA